MSNRLNEKRFALPLTLPELVATPLASLQCTGPSAQSHSSRALGHQPLKDHNHTHVQKTMEHIKCRMLGWIVIETLAFMLHILYTMTEHDRKDEKTNE